MRVPILRLAYGEEDIRFILDGIDKVIRSGFLTMHDRVLEFERSFAEFCGVRYAVGTNSGTSSLEIILRIIGVEGSTVVVPSNTYMATAIAVVKAGGRVIFADCRKEDMQLDPEDLKRKVRLDTKAVILVHIGGIISPNYYEIKEFCDRQGLPLIEDAAHAHGATIDDHGAGSLGLAGSFSFYPTKVLTTAEGGMITTDNEEVYKKALVLREHGKANHDFNVHVEFGDNWRFSEVHAILGLQQMRKASWILEERRRIARLYDDLLAEVPRIRPLKIPENVRSAYYKYITFLDPKLDREALKRKLLKQYEVALTGEVYSHPCHSQPVFKKYPHTMANALDDKFPATDYVCQHHICLPLYPGLKDAEVRYVVDSLREVVST